MSAPGMGSGELSVERNLAVESLSLDEMFRIVRMFDNLALILKNRPAAMADLELFLSRSVMP